MAQHETPNGHNMKKSPKTKGIGTEAVKAKTGKTLSEWFRILDDLGAKKLPHKEIVKHLHEKEKVPGWWCQMVTVEYERARGLRELHQKSTGGFAASASRTLDAPLSKVYKAWADEVQRSLWLPKGKIQVTTTTKNKYFRAAWDGNKSRINVGFYAKGADRCQVALDHEKLRSAAECAKMKKYWHAALGRLEKLLAP
jgi:hypothetical protein